MLVVQGRAHWVEAGSDAGCESAQLQIGQTRLSRKTPGNLLHMGAEV